MMESKIREDKFKKVVEEALRTPTSQVNETTKLGDRPKDWKDLQIKVKEIYENLGCEVKEDVKIKGARTKHKIDVLASFEFGGQNYRIVIECKYWNTKVKKIQVGSLLGILADIGAEKGIIVSTMGFQSGAQRLASYTNIELLTFDELKEKSKRFIEKLKIRNALDRIHSLSIPFAKFRSMMSEEAEKKDLFWYPSEHGWNFIASLATLRSNIELLDLKTFPRAYIYSFISKRKKEVFKVAKNRAEYLEFALNNLKILEKEYEKFKKQIFSE